MTAKRVRTKLSLVLVAGLTILGMGGCGDDGGPAPGFGPGDDSDLDFGQADDSGDGAGGSGSSDACNLLETSEVEAEFGDLGPVADGYEDAGGCFWEVGDQEGFGTPEGLGDWVSVFTLPTDPNMSLEEAMEQIGPTAESIDGIGDEAWLTDDMTILVFRSGSTEVSLTTSLPPVEGMGDRLIALAEQIAGRL